MSEKDWDLYLRLILLMTMIVFLISFTLSPKDDCDKCSFKMPNGKRLNTGEVLNDYFEVCIDPFTGELNKHELDLTNFALNKSTG